MIYWYWEAFGNLHRRRLEITDQSSWNRERTDYIWPREEITCSRWARLPLKMWRQSGNDPITCINYIYTARSMKRCRSGVRENAQLLDAALRRTISLWRKRREKQNSFQKTKRKWNTLAWQCWNIIVWVYGCLYALRSCSGGCNYAVMALVEHKCLFMRKRKGNKVPVSPSCNHSLCKCIVWIYVPTYGLCTV